MSDYDRNYYEAGPQTGKSLYQNYRWIPELTIPLAHHFVQYMGIKYNEPILDFGCAKGYLVHALRLLDYKAFGVDISDYAISQAPREVAPYVKLVRPFPEIGVFDHIICKDVLEHVDYTDIDLLLQILADRCYNTLAAIVPLGDGQKYFIDAYELDKTHKIRQDVPWWEQTFQKAGFASVTVTTDLGPFKANWSTQHPKGNALIIAKNDEV